MTEDLRVKAKLNLTIDVPNDRPDLLKEANRILDGIIPVALLKLQEISEETDGFDFLVDHIE